MDNEITIREWVRRWNAGDYTAKGIKTQCDAGWYDWFCRDSSLAGRLEKFGRILSNVTNDFLLDNYRVWFKNNCPMSGPLYDDMRFEPMDYSLRDTHYFGISVDDKRMESKYTVFTARKGYNDEFHFKTLHEVVHFLNEWRV